MDRKTRNAVFYSFAAAAAAASAVPFPAFAATKYTDSAASETSQELTAPADGAQKRG